MNVQTKRTKMPLHPSCYIHHFSSAGDIFSFRAKDRQPFFLTGDVGTLWAIVKLHCPSSMRRLIGWRAMMHQAVKKQATPWF